LSDRGDEHFPGTGAAAGRRGELPEVTAAAADGAAETEGPPFVVVLGMHRSGTSLCSHLLTRLGIDMADDPAAQPSNPKGHWERPEIVQRHDRILELLDRGYMTPLHDLPLPSGWWLDPRVAEIRREIIGFIEQKRRGGAPFGFKDPRTARLLPLWHQVFAELGLAPKIVLCLRNPAQVARSLQERDGLPPDTGEYRWFTYMAEALQNLGNCQSCTLEYEAWFDGAGDNLGKLTRFLGLPPNPAAASALADIVDPQLCHDDPAVREPSQPLVRALYDLVRRSEADGTARAELQALLDRWAAFRQLQRPIELEFETLSRFAAGLPRGDGEPGDYRAVSWRHPTAETEWRKLAAGAGETEALQARLQKVLTQRAELDAALARAQQRAALRDRAAELAEQEIAALRREIAARDRAPVETGSHPDEPTSSAAEGSPLDQLAQTPVPAGGTLDPAVAAELIEAVLQKGDREQIERLTEQRAGDTEFNYVLSLKLIEAGFADPAERAARNAARHGAREARYYERLGSILWARGKLEDAIGTMRIACELAGEWSYPQERLAMMLAERQPAATG